MVRRNKILSLSVPLLLGTLSGCYYPVYTTYPAYPYGYPPATPAPAPQVTVAPNGQECREYTKEVIIAGQKQQAVGTACRQPDGSWKDSRDGQVFKAPPPLPPAPPPPAPPPPAVMPVAPPPQPPVYYYNYPYNGYYAVPQR